MSPFFFVVISPTVFNFSAFVCNRLSLPSLFIAIPIFFIYPFSFFHQNNFFLFKVWFDGSLFKKVGYFDIVKKVKNSLKSKKNSLQNQILFKIIFSLITSHFSVLNCQVFSPSLFLSSLVVSSNLVVSFSFVSSEISSDYKNFVKNWQFSQIFNRKISLKIGCSKAIITESFFWKSAKAALWKSRKSRLYIGSLVIFS